MGENTIQPGLMPVSEVLDTLLKEHRGYTSDLVGRHINMVLTGKCDSIAPASGAYYLKRNEDVIQAVSRTGDGEEHVMNFSGDAGNYDSLGLDPEDYRPAEPEAKP